MGNLAENTQSEFTELLKEKDRNIPDLTFDEVDLAAYLSFPASDPPAWTCGKRENIELNIRLKDIYEY